MTESKIPAAPGHLSARAKRLWKQIVSEYLLSAAQLELLRRACEAAGVADQARAQLKREGLTEKDRFGQRRAHPAVAIERDARLAEARLIRELALSPEEPEEPYSRPPRTGTASTGRAS